MQLLLYNICHIIQQEPGYQLGIESGYRLNN
jgi:hypothetical protein